MGDIGIHVVAAGRLSAMKNIGAVTEQRLRAVDIATPQELEAVGAVQAYLMLRDRFPVQHASLLCLYYLQGALCGLHWNELPETTKDNLKRALRKAEKERQQRHMLLRVPS